MHMLFGENGRCQRTTWQAKVSIKSAQPETRYWTKSKGENICAETSAMKYAMNYQLMPQETML
eukprot:6127578-Amphidinium_carterae.1